MANTFTQLLYHIVFSTKQRRPWITEEIEERLYPYLGGIVRDERAVLLAVGGTADHIHLLIRFHANGKLCDLVRQIKSGSSGWVHDQYPALGDFAWQEVYGGFTVSPSASPDVKEYIKYQKEHHRRRDFREEFLTMLRLHEVEFDERYVFD